MQQLSRQENSCESTYALDVDSDITHRNKCDGEQPVCNRCSQLKLDCQYRPASKDEASESQLKRQIDQLQQELSEHAQILEHLRSVSEPEAISVIRRLRSTPNTTLVLSSLRDNAHSTTRISEQKTLRGMLPPTDFELEFELSVLHGSVYPVLMPLDLSSIDMDSLFPSAIHNPSRTMPSDDLRTAQEAFFIDPRVTTLPPSPLRGSRSPRISPVAGPAPDRQYCDSRLNDLKIAYWSCVPISDEFAACVLSHYLKIDHPIFACVDADLFLSGLVDRTLEHCSPFLVSALMSFACVSRSALYELSDNGKAVVHSIR